MEENKSRPDSPKKGRIPLLKHYVPVWALLLAVLLTSAVFASVLLIGQKGITVNEPLIITPSSQTFSIFAGETMLLNFTVANFATVAIPVTLAASLSPDEPSITLTIQGGTAQDMQPGGNVVAVSFAASPSTPIGEYTVTLSVTR